MQTNDDIPCGKEVSISELMFPGLIIDGHDFETGTLKRKDIASGCTVQIW